MNINLKILKIRELKKEYNDQYINLFVPIDGNKENITFFLECLKKSIDNNCNFKNIFLFINKSKKEDQEIINNFIDSYNKDFISKIYFEDKLTFNFIFSYINSNFDSNNYNMVIRSNIIIPKQSILHILPYKLKDNNFYCLSSMETNNNKVWKDPIKLKLFYSTSQDAWIFKTPIKLDFDKLPQIEFNVIQNELIFNYFINENNKLLNDTNSFKILKCHNKKLDLSYLNKKTEENINTKKYLPENLLFNKIPLTQFVQILKMSKEEIYKLKCQLFENKINNN